ARPARADLLGRGTARRPRPLRRYRALRPRRRTPGDPPPATRDLRRGLAGRAPGTSRDQTRQRLDVAGAGAAAAANQPGPFIQPPSHPRGVRLGLVVLRQPPAGDIVRLA